MYEIGLVDGYAGEAICICGPFYVKDTAINCMHDGNRVERPSGYIWMWAREGEIRKANDCERVNTDSARAKELGLVS